MYSVEIGWWEGPASGDVSNMEKEGGTGPLIAYNKYDFGHTMDLENTIDTMNGI